MDELIGGRICAESYMNYSETRQGTENEWGKILQGMIM